MAYDFEYYSGAYLTVPTKPVKPVLGRNPTAVDARAFADALEEYEREYKGYQEDLSWYRGEKSNLLTAFRDKLCSDYNLSDKAFDLIWAKAWERGHSSGLHEVYQEFDDLHDFIQEWDKMK